MARFTGLVTSVLVVAATLAVAHTGVTNPAVMARMESMKDMQDHTKVLGNMAKGVVAFDVETARAALTGVAQEAAKTPDLFKAEETDPKSEALPVIWEAYADFVAKSDALEALAVDLSSRVTSKDSLAEAVAQLGGACKACHSKYRE